MWQFCMGKQEISGSNVAMSMQQIKMLACEGASGKLPVLIVCDADVVSWVCHRHRTVGDNNYSQVWQQNLLECLVVGKRGKL